MYVKQCDETHVGWSIIVVVKKTQNLLEDNLVVQLSQLLIVLLCVCVAESLPDEGTYFIVSPKDVVVSRQRDSDDHVQWLIEHEMFEVSIG
jgi:hypothetical protein